MINSLPIHFAWFEGSLSYPHYLSVHTAALTQDLPIIFWIRESALDETNLWQQRIGRIAELKVIPEEWLTFDREVKFVFLSDLIRYKVLSLYGGLYLDTDTVCLKQVSQFSDGESIVLGRQSEKDVNGAIFYSPIPNHPLVLAMLSLWEEKLERNEFREWGAAGPKLITSVLETASEGVILLEKECFYPFDWREAGANSIFREFHPLDDTIVLHWFEAGAKRVIPELLEELTPRRVLLSSNTYGRAVKRALGIDGEIIEPVVRNTPRVTQSELDLLIRASVLSAGDIVEIGTYRGGTLENLAHYLPELFTLWSIDNYAFERAYPSSRIYKRIAKYPHTFLIVGDSKKIGLRWQSKLTTLFIDGDHSYEGVRGDYEAWKDHLSPDGFLILHDAAGEGRYHTINGETAGPWDGVPQLYSELLNEGWDLVASADTLVVLCRS